MHKEFFNIIKSLKISTQSLISILFLVGSVFISSNKLLFVWSGLYLISQFFSTRSFFLTIIYSFLPLSLINVGQTYGFNVVPARFLQGAAAQIYASGRNLFFIFSPYYAFLLTSIAGVFISFFIFNKNSKKNKPKKEFLIFILLLIVGQQVVSSAQSAFLPSLSLLYVIGGLGVIAFLWISSKYLNSVGSRVKKNIYQEIYRQLLIITLFQSVIVLMQVLLKSNLGLTIEISKSISVFGLGADESFLQFRPMGLYSHANNLANHFLILLFGIGLFSKYSLVKKNKTDWLKWTTLALLILSLIFTLSRAAYLSLAIYFLGMIIFFKKDFINEWKVFINFSLKYKKYLYAFLLLMSTRIIPRIIQTIYSFGATGGFFNRSELVKLSFEIFKKYPLMGVGQGMFIPAGLATNPSGVISYFPESVHNGFLLTMVEQGLVGLILNLLFIYLFIKHIFNSPFSKYKKGKIAFSLIALASMMFFHPIRNILSIYTLLVILIL